MEEERDFGRFFSPKNVRKDGASVGIGVNCGRKGDAKAKLTAVFTLSIYPSLPRVMEC